MAELEHELLEYAKRRYISEKKDLLAVLDMKTREVEEYKERVRELQDQSEQLEKILSDERESRIQDLSTHEHELLNLQQHWGSEQRASKEELEAGRSIIERLNAQIDSYKKEIKQMLDENTQEVSAAQKEITARETQIETLRIHEKELESKLSLVEGAARDEKQKLQSRILELEQVIAKEREAKKAFEVETKNALSLSTASLIDGRSETSALKGQLNHLTIRIKELEEEKSKIIEDWHAERKKWEELWMKERAVWESQMQQSQEFSARSGKERAQWENMMRAKEEKEIRLTRVFSSFLAEFNRMKNQWTFSESGTTGQEEIDASLALEEDKATQAAKVRRRWVISGMAVLLIALTASTFYYWQYSRKPILFSQAAYWEIPIGTPSGLAPDPVQNNALWISDWKTGELVKTDKSDPSRVLGRFKTSLTFFHPNSIAFSGDGKYLFALDSVSHKIYKLNGSDPSKLIEEAPTPSPASLFLTMLSDPSPALAVLDTIEKKIYFYDPSALHSKPKAVELAQDISPVGISGRKNIWILDAKSGLVLPLEARPDGTYKRGRGIKAVLSAEFPELPSASGFLMFERDREIYAAFEGEPGKVAFLKSPVTK